MAFVQPPPSPAILAARKSMDEQFPGRKSGSDGMSGDQAHLDRCMVKQEAGQGKCEGHVMGDAIDITTDPEHGVINREIAEAALLDRRTAYVISNGEIATPKHAPSFWAGKGWRKYTGANRHDHHTHISIIPELRNDGSPWDFKARPEPEQADVLTRKPVNAVKLVTIGAGIGAALYYGAKAIFKW